MTEPRWLIKPGDVAERLPQKDDQTEKPDDDPLAPGTISEVFKPIGRYQGKTAAQWRDMARSGRKASLDSFDRCDTDGALTQWANDSMARKYDLCAQLAENDGIWEFPALFSLTGGLVPDAVWIKTRPKYGSSKWVWRIGKGQTVAWFDPSKARSGARRRANDAAKGYQLGTIRARGYVGTSGSGRGLSGAMSVGYFIGKVDDSPVEIVDNGTLGTQYIDR